MSTKAPEEMQFEKYRSMLLATKAQGNGSSLYDYLVELLLKLIRSGGGESAGAGQLKRKQFTCFSQYDNVRVNASFEHGRPRVRYYHSVFNSPFELFWGKSFGFVVAICFTT
jgi:hypothetical protein